MACAVLPHCGPLIQTAFERFLSMSPASLSAHPDRLSMLALNAHRVVVNGLRLGGPTTAAMRAAFRPLEHPVHKPRPIAHVVMQSNGQRVDTPTHWPSRATHPCEQAPAAAGMQDRYLRITASAAQWAAARHNAQAAMASALARHPAPTQAQSVPNSRNPWVIAPAMARTTAQLAQSAPAPSPPSRVQLKRSCGQHRLTSHIKPSVKVNPGTPVSEDAHSISSWPAPALTYSVPPARLMSCTQSAAASAK